jgi:osmotically-inducible protein OsmY
VESERAADKTVEGLTDAAITSEVKTKFLAEPGVSGLDIHVDTNNGVVTLSGNVKSKAEAAKAMSIARDSKGVKRVVNHLKRAA